MGAHKKTYCIRGHALSGDNAYVSKDGSKHCKACKRITDKIRLDNNRESYNQYQKDYRYKNYNKVIKHERKSDQKRYKKKLSYARKWYPDYKRKLRIEVLSYYGNGKLACVCCNETIFDFLTLDHINGNGGQERKDKPRRRAWMLLQWLRSMSKTIGKYPEGYQTLCWNCNSGRALNKGICPHKIIEKVQG